MRKDRLKKDSWMINTPVAHRGLHGGEIVENTLTAYGEAIKAGFAIEIDVQLTKDNAVVVNHDFTLDRLTGVKAKVNEKTLEEIKNIPFLQGTDRMPTFEETLNYVNGRTPLLIEIKNEGKVGILEEKTLELLRPYKGEFAIQSFNPKSVAYFTKHAPEFIRGQLSYNYCWSQLSKFKRNMLANLHFDWLTKSDFVSYYQDNIPCKAVEKFKNRGGVVLAWTITSEEMEKQKRPYIDNIIFEDYVAEIPGKVQE